MHIGNKIRIEVINRNISVTKFAKLIHRSRAYIYSIFEKEHIDTNLLMQVAAVLGIPVVRFFDGIASDVTQNTEGNSNIMVGRDNIGNIYKNHINITLPESGTQKIINPDGRVEILRGNPSNIEPELLKKEIELLKKEIELLQKEKDMFFKFNS